MDKITSEGMFNYAIEFVLNHEGRFSNNKSDPGGATNYGISLRFLKLAGIDIDGDGDIDINDILTIDKAKAREIYKSYWWDTYHYWAINDADIAKKILDLSINMGPSRAHKIAQISVNRLIDTPIKVDGKLGPKTFGAINSLIAEERANDLYGELKDNAAHYYINLVADRPELKVFLRGWLKRAND